MKKKHLLSIALTLFNWLWTSNYLLGSIHLLSVSYIDFLKISWTAYKFLPLLEQTCSAVFVKVYRTETVKTII